MLNGSGASFPGVVMWAFRDEVVAGVPDRNIYESGTGSTSSSK